ncbi:MAG: DegT/DnrJ/EryC1/StrS aminotransferase family protein [Flavobacteriales bacterium TMED235]|nr:MAG: DegT/DnrJ/EryC1/StrS aminotransferase family protein [Flavobacteriales bacterium TMED235]
MRKFNNLISQYKKNKKNIDKSINQVLRDGNFIMGKEIYNLEEKLKKITNSKYCISVSSGTDALLISLMSLNIKPGDEVITTSFSWISTAEVIVNLGAKPVFIDVDPNTGLIKESLIEKMITKKTKAVIIVSLFGQIPNMNYINSICNKKKIPVIEDGAQSFGSKYKNKYSCNLTTLGCTSFFPTKNLGCYGDGGAIFTNSYKLQKACKEIRLNGKNKYNNFVRIGVQGRMDNLQASILLAKLKSFRKELKYRKYFADKYIKALKIYFPKIKIVGADNFYSSSWPSFNIIVKNRDKLKKIFRKK